MGEFQQGKFQQATRRTPRKVGCRYFGTETQVGKIQNAAPETSKENPASN